ncbi:extracellular solute-binding protein [Streptomyces sp. ID05-04B]|uniref:ABC transporter substrate-binding protein n=1 Tax=Streptomyces sp. ID05-04B TaxID=3028661 RepID=UPI0029C2088D|nr:extracellular solute-binding protein [Streptomyces sp. ID05-04B]MDX5569431.1 extracellular solute-binding protein [Streptomyces sp. ID05-04B]
MNHSSRPRRRARLRAVGLTCSVFALVLSAGCAADSSGSDGGKAVIRFNWWGSDSRHEMTKQMIALFEKEHPDITVQLEYSNWDDYWKKLSTGAAAGDMPDVLQITDPFMYSYIDNGQLMDLKKVKDVLNTDKLPANSMAMTTVKGGLYGVPAGDSAFGIAADPAAFKKAGVPMPDDTTWSWDDYVKISEAISKTKGMVGTVMPLYPNDLGPWLRQHGEDYWSEDGSQIGFTEETMAAYWRWVVKLRDSGGTTSADAAVEALASGAGVEQNLVAQHKAAMTDVSVTQLGALEGAGGRETKLLLFPGEKDASQVGAYTKPGIFFGASARTEHPKEAAELLDFLVNSPEAAKIQKFDRGVPDNPDVLKAITPELSPVEKRIAEYLGRVNDLKPTALHIPNAKAGPAVPETFQRLNEDVLFDRLSPQEAAEKFISEIKSQL